MPNKITEPFDFEKSPSMSSQMFEAAPGVFGGMDGISPLQAANRVIIGGPVDIFDLIGRAGESGLRGAAEFIGEGYESLGGGQGMSERLKRDIYGLGQIGGLLTGASPSSLSSARAPSTRRAAPSDPAQFEGIIKAIEGPEKPAGLLPAPKKLKPLEGEIVGKSDKYIRLEAQQDKARSQALKDSIEEEKSLEALRDSFQNIENDVQESFDYYYRAIGEDSIYDAGSFYDNLEDTFMSKIGSGVPKNQALIESIEDVTKEYSQFMSADNSNFFDVKNLTKGMGAKADDYGFGVGKEIKRREEAAANKLALTAELSRAKQRTANREYEQSLGITDDMSPAQRQAILDADHDRMVQEALGAQMEAAGMGISEAKPQKPNLRVVIDNDEVQKKNLATEKFKDEFEYDVFHGQRDPEVSIGVTKSRDGREMLVEDATGEYGGINAFQSSADKFPSHYPTDLGTFVSESRDVANYFAGDRGAVYPLKMRMKNPMRYETYEDLEDALNEVGDTSELTNQLIKEGYDGIEITYSDTDIPEIRRDFIPFDGRQLRSVNAKFDPEKRDSRNITYKNGGMVYNPFKMGIGAF